MKTLPVGGPVLNQLTQEMHSHVCRQTPVVNKPSMTDGASGPYRVAAAAPFFHLHDKLGLNRRQIDEQKLDRNTSMWDLNRQLA